MDLFLAKERFLFAVNINDAEGFGVDDDDNVTFDDFGGDDDDIDEVSQNSSCWNIFKPHLSHKREYQFPQAFEGRGKLFHMVFDLKGLILTEHSECTV